MTHAPRFYLFFGALLAAQCAFALTSVQASHFRHINAPSHHISVALNHGAMAQNLIETLGDKALGALADKKISATQRKKLFHTLLTSNFDTKTIGKFALGRFWRLTTQAQKTEYEKLYKEMIVEVYTSRFNNYSGQKFTVTGNRVDASGDVIVNSTVIGNGPPVQVDWRVRPKNGHYHIIDVMVEGVSMALTQRNDFASVIQQGGGNIDALLAYLRTQISK